jgi:hypothetical protein
MHYPNEHTKSIVMKKFLIIALVALISGKSVSAMNGETTNTKAVTKFNADFKGATGIWNEGKTYNEVLFYWHNELMDSYYDKEGNLIGTFHQVEATELPAGSLDKIGSWYKGYTIKNTTMMDKDDEPSVYYAIVESPTHIVILQISQDGDVELFKTLR